MEFLRFKFVQILLRLRKYAVLGSIPEHSMHSAPHSDLSYLVQHQLEPHLPVSLTHGYLQPVPARGRFASPEKNPLQNNGPFVSRSDKIILLTCTIDHTQFFINLQSGQQDKTRKYYLLQISPENPTWQWHAKLVPLLTEHAP